MLAVTLQTNDNDQEHLSVSRQNLCFAKSKHFVDMVMTQISGKAQSICIHFTQFIFRRDMGLHLFRLHIVLNNLVQTRTVEGLLMLIEKERQGDTVDRTLLKSLLRMLSDLQIYQEAFETKYVINPSENSVCLSINVFPHDIYIIDSLIC